MNLTQRTNWILYNLFSRGEGVSDPSQLQCVRTPPPRRDFNLNKSVNTMAPSSSFRLYSVSFSFCFSPSIWVQPVYVWEKRNGSKTRGARARLLSRTGLKILLLFARYPSHLPVLFSTLFHPSSFASFLSPRFFWISAPHAYLARSPVDSLCSSHAPNRRSLAINKKRKKKRKNNESGAGATRVSRE